MPDLAIAAERSQSVRAAQAAARVKEAAVAWTGLRRSMLEGAAPDAVPTVDVPVNGQKDVHIVDLVVSAFAKSKTQARQLVAQKGVRVDGTIASEDTKVPVKGEPLVQIGRRQAVRVRFR